MFDEKRNRFRKTIDSFCIVFEKFANIANCFESKMNHVVNRTKIFKIDDTRNDDQQQS